MVQLLKSADCCTSCKEAVIVRVYGLGAAAPAVQVAGQGPLQAFSTSALGASAGQFAQYSLLLPLQNKGEPAYRLSLPTSPGRHVEFTLKTPVRRLWQTAALHLHAFQTV